MTLATAWQKLRALGVPYTLQFKVWSPLRDRLRGAATRLSLNTVGPGLLVQGRILIQRDRDSRICFGRACDLQPSVSLRSTRRHALAAIGEIVVGDNCILKRESVLIAKSARIQLGDRCSVGRYTEISCEDVNVTIGDNVRIASQVWISTSTHVFNDPDIPIVEQGSEQRPVTIHDDVWLGTKVVVLPGVTIGRGAVVAASAVVTKDVPPFVIVGGIPARVIKRRGD